MKSGKIGQDPNSIYKSTKKCPYPSKGLFRKNGKLYERIVENFMIRDVLIPSHGVNIQKTYFNTDDYGKISGFASEVVLNAEEKYISVKKEKAKEIEASASRVSELRKIDSDRAANKTEGRSDLAEEDQDKSDYSIKRAKELVMNQKDEMKMCNKYIMEAKCQEIRKNQLVEKKLREDEEKKVLKQENEIMIQKMLDDAVEYEKEKELIQKKKKQYVEGINSQIKENELRRQIEAEQINEEGRLNREASCQEMLNAIDERNNKKKMQLESVQKLNDYNKNVISYMKAVENEEKKIEERKIKEYQDDKVRKEQEVLDEKNRLKNEKEAILAKMMERQKKSMEDGELREEIHTQYVQDMVERKWRQKEREEMEKKMRQKEDMIESRKRQKHRKNELLAAETLAEKEDFYSRLKVLDDQKEKEKEDEKKKKIIAHKHMIELKNQINDRETKTIEERKKKFTEGKAMDAARDADVKETKQYLERKIHELEDYNLPSNCQHEIRRKLMKHKFL